MHISNGKQTIKVPRHLRHKVKKYIQNNEHQAVSQMFGSAPQNPEGMQEGPSSQGNGMMFNFGGTVGSILGAVAPLASAIPGIGTVAGIGLQAGAQLIGNQLQKDNQPKMARGGKTHSVDINVEGHGRSQGTQAQMSKGELLVKNGKIHKNYIHRPPHPKHGMRAGGNVSEEEGTIVIPKKRTQEYLNGGMVTRKGIERSLVSQQDHRMNKHLDGLRKFGGLTLPFYAKGGEVNLDSETLGAETDGQYNNGGNVGQYMGMYNMGGMLVPEKAYPKRILAKEGIEVSSPSYYGSDTPSSEQQNYFQDWRNPINYGGTSNASNNSLQPNTDIFSPHKFFGTQMNKDVANAGLSYNSPYEKTRGWQSQKMSRIPNIRMNAQGQASSVNNDNDISDRDMFNKDQNWTMGLQGLGIANNLISSFEKTDTIKPQRINPLSPRFIDTNTGRDASRSAYKSLRHDIGSNLPGMIAANSQFQKNENERNIGIANQNAGIYNQYSQQDQAAQQFNSQSDTEAQKLRLMAEANKRQFRSQAFNDIGKLGQNRMNNELYYQYLNKSV